MARKSNTTETTNKENTAPIAETTSTPTSAPEATPTNTPIVNSDEALAKAFLTSYDMANMPRDNRDALVWLTQGIAEVLLAYNAIQGTDISV